MTLSMDITVVENEQLWFGTLFSMGDDIEILASEKLRKRLISTAEKIFFLYK